MSDDSKILAPNGKPLRVDTPLILTGGADTAKPYENWKYWVDHTSKGKSEKPKGLDEGFGLKHGERQEETKAEKTCDAWELPPSFCPYCGNNDVPVSAKKSRGAHLINNEYPGLGLIKGSLVMAYGEDACIYKYIMGNDDEHEQVINTDAAPTFRADQKRNKALIVEERVIAFIHARRMAGDRDKILGDETRKQRFAELNERAE